MTKTTKNIAISSILISSLLTIGTLGYSIYHISNNVVQNDVAVIDQNDEANEIDEFFNGARNQEAAGGRSVLIIMSIALVIGGLIIANIMILLLFANYGKRSRTFIEQNVNGKILKEEITVAIEEYKQRRDIVDKKVEKVVKESKEKDKKTTAESKSKKTDNKDSKNKDVKVDGKDKKGKVKTAEVETKEIKEVETVNLKTAKLETKEIKEVETVNLKTAKLETKEIKIEEPVIDVKSMSEEKIDAFKMNPELSGEANNINEDPYSTAALEIGTKKTKTKKTKTKKISK